MNQMSSAFEGAAAGWGYIRPGFGRTGRSLTENNFAKERRDWLSILLREVLQNALDARLNEPPPDAPRPPVSLVLRRVNLSMPERQFVSGLITPEHLERFRESVPHLPPDRPR